MSQRTKRLRRVVHSESLTSPLMQSDANHGSVEKKGPPIVEVSSSQQETQNKGTGLNECYADSEYLWKGDGKYEACLEVIKKVDRMDTKLENVVQSMDEIRQFIMNKVGQYSGSKKPTPDALYLRSDTSQKGLGKKTILSIKTKNTNPTVLVNHASPTGFYITPTTTTHGPPNILANYVPSWLETLFNPVFQVILTDDEVAVASYIFGNSDELKGNEVIVTPDVQYCHGTRDLLRQLKPGLMIDGDVLNLVASLLTHNERSVTDKPIYWFLPTTFTQFVLSWSAGYHTMIKYYKREFMGPTDRLSKVDEGSRLRLTLELTMHSYNTIEDVIISKAKKYIEKCKENSK
ncbi:hypothetical protein SESBI_13083 [Sesbania bispinosa]|nr:hypothetical protein SESBI_13083 [Sesbania bispinosa]